MGATLSLVGVLLGAMGGFMLATTYDHKNPIERRTGLAIGLFLAVVGIGLFVAGWWI